jgi:hypothetical protein
MAGAISFATQLARLSQKKVIMMKAGHHFELDAECPGFCAAHFATVTAFAFASAKTSYDKCSESSVSDLASISQAGPQIIGRNEQRWSGF